MSAQGDVLLEAVGIRKSFGAHEVLSGIDLDVRRGEVVCIIGPSGSGKSTLLRCLNHLEAPDTGGVYIDGELIGYRLDGTVARELRYAELARQRSRIGMVFQSFNLFPHLTVRENITEAPIVVHGVSKAAAAQRADALLARVGLAGRGHAYPRQLSGGQQQRVAIARALAIEPSLMLFDEPTSALDPELVGEVLDVIADLAASGSTMVVVTHEIGFARRVADTVVFMDAGAVVEQGPPDQVLDDPQHPRTRAFLASVLA